MNNIQENQDLDQQRQHNVQNNLFLNRDINEFDSDIQISKVNSTFHKINDHSFTVQFDSNTNNFENCGSSIQTDIMNEVSQEQINENIQAVRKLSQQNKSVALNFFCDEHQDEIKMFNLATGINKEKRLCCVECCPEKYVPLSKCKEKWEQYEKQLIQHLKNIEINKLNLLQLIEQKLKIMMDVIKETIQSFLITYKSTQHKLIDQIYNITNKTQKKKWEELTKEEVIEIAEYLSESQEQYIFSYQNKYDQQDIFIKKQFDLIFSELINKQNKLYNELSSDIYQTPEQKAQRQLQEIILNAKKSNDQIERQDSQVISDNQISQIIQNKQDIVLQEYVLINQYIQTEDCHALVFNQDNTLMINGAEDTLIIWDFKDGQLQQLQQLNEHTNLIVSLCYDSKQNEIFSGSTDKTIRRWKMNQQRLWYCQQILIGHKRQVDCILKNQLTNQLISCSSDRSIKIWQNNNNNEDEYIQIQNLDNHTAYVRCVSLNLQQNQLVSCSEDKTIIIWTINNINFWCLKQLINTEDFGYRICFINDNIIAWQPRNLDQTIIFKLNQLTNYFEQQKKTIQLVLQSDGYQNFFPSIYNQSKNVLINKHGKYIYIIKQNDNNQEFIIHQTIDLGHYCNYGNITSDGQFLVTWDEGSKQIQIRQYKY